MSCTIASVRIPTGDQPICGVLLDPCIFIRDESTNRVEANSIPDETPQMPYGEPEPAVVIRSRWYRQATTAEDCVCSVHPENDAVIQCLLCLKSRVPVNLSYHCSCECLQAHWAHHRNIHARYMHQIPYMHNGYENGYHHNPYTSMNTGFCQNNNIPTYKNEEYDWIEVGSARCYSPCPEDVGCFLRYECSLVFQGNSKPLVSTQNGGVHGNGHITDNSSLTETPRYYRMTKETARVKAAPSPTIRNMVPIKKVASFMKDKTFTVLSYNILADLFASQGDFYHSSCPPWAIYWNYRRQNLVKELLSYQADILCLQEVQSNHYEDYLKHILESNGYEGVYKRKTSEVYVGKGSATDGCATFFRKDRFSMIKKYEVEFNKAAVTTANNYPEPTRQVALQRLSKDNVALIVVLESQNIMVNNQKQLICVANTHIHSNPENSDIKFWQVHTLLKGLEKIASSAKIPIIVAGDFNSEPTSAAHTLLVGQRVDLRHPEAANDPAQFLHQMLPVQHNLPLRSAYAALLHAPISSDNDEVIRQRQRMDAVTKEPIFTNYTKNYKGTLDYIFYTYNMLTPTALLELPSEEEADIENGIPNTRYSSDHICIMAEFELNC